MVDSAALNFLAPTTTPSTLNSTALDPIMNDFHDNPQSSSSSPSSPPPQPNQHQQQQQQQQPMAQPQLQPQQPPTSHGGVTPPSDISPFPSSQQLPLPPPQNPGHQHQYPLPLQQQQQQQQQQMPFNHISQQQQSQGSPQNMRPRKRKQYAKRACSNCKSAHAACSDNRPCDRCVRLGIADSCVDAERKKPVARPKRKRKHPMKGVGTKDEKPDMEYSASSANAGDVVYPAMADYFPYSPDIHFNPHLAPPATNSSYPSSYVSPSSASMDVQSADMFPGGSSGNINAANDAPGANTGNTGDSTTTANQHQLINYTHSPFGAQQTAQQQQQQHPAHYLSSYIPQTIYLPHNHNPHDYHHFPTGADHSSSSEVANISHQQQQYQQQQQQQYPLSPSFFNSFSNMSVWSPGLPSPDINTHGDLTADYLQPPDTDRDTPTTSGDTTTKTQSQEHTDQYPSPHSSTPTPPKQQQDQHKQQPNYTKESPPSSATGSKTYDGSDVEDGSVEDMSGSDSEDGYDIHLDLTRKDERKNASDTNGDQSNEQSTGHHQNHHHQNQNHQHQQHQHNHHPQTHQPAHNHRKDSRWMGNLLSNLEDFMDSGTDTVGTNGNASGSGMATEMSGDDHSGGTRPYGANEGTLVTFNNHSRMLTAGTASGPPAPAPTSAGTGAGSGGSSGSDGTGDGGGVGHHAGINFNKPMTLREVQEALKTVVETQQSHVNEIAQVKNEISQVKYVLKEIHDILISKNSNRSKKQRH